MNASDFDTFAVEFRRLSSALERYKQSPAEQSQKADAYFHVLKKFSIYDVIAKADQWLATEKNFPKPSEWAAVIVRKVVEWPVLTQAEADEYRAAELSAWEAPPCHCAECVRAEVSDKPIRYVPEFDRNDVILRAKEPNGDKLLYRGHWIHGFDLKRWYDARAAFWNKCHDLKLIDDAMRARIEHMPMAEGLGKVLAKMGDPQ